MMLNYRLFIFIFIVRPTSVCSFKVPLCLRYLQTYSLTAGKLISSSWDWYYVKKEVACIKLCQHAGPCDQVVYDARTHICRIYKTDVDLNQTHQEEYFPQMLGFGFTHYRDCTDIKSLMDPAQSGVYIIKPCASCEKRRVYCDMDTGEGGWTVIQNRRDGSVDFYRDWGSYKFGFGDMCGEFWLGNEFIYKMTSSATYELRIDIGDADGFAVYSYFRIGSEANKYVLDLGPFVNGNIGDAMSNSNGNYFSTKDKDNDECPCTPTCAVRYMGAWWFGWCFHSHLNGKFDAEMEIAQGIAWSIDQTYHRYYRASMKLRRTSV